MQIELDEEEILTAIKMYISNKNSNEEIDIKKSNFYIDFWGNLNASIEY